MPDGQGMLLKTDGSERIRYTDEVYPIYQRVDVVGVNGNPCVASHWHDDIEMSFIMEGRMWCDINGERVTLETGDCVLINARQLHRDQAPEGESCRYDTAIFHPSILTGANPAVDLCVRRIVTHPCYPYDVFRAANAADRILIEKVKTLMLRVADPTPARLLGTVAAACELLYALIPRLPERSLGQRPDRHLSTVRAMTGFIQEHYAEKITLADIARAGMIGERTVNTLFRKWFSETPLTYLTHYRLEKAAGLLESTDLPITEIALDTGFSDANYFAICFRKQFAMSPTEYRNGRSGA